MDFHFTVRTPQWADVYCGNVKVMALSIIYRTFETHPVRMLLSGESMGHTLVLNEQGEVQWAKQVGEDWEPFGAVLAMAEPGIPFDKNPAIVTMERTGMLVRKDKQA